MTKLLKNYPAPHKEVAGGVSQVSTLMPQHSKTHRARSGSPMDVFLIEAGHPEPVLVSRIDHGHAGDVRDWFCYTKPIGADLKVIARPRVDTHPGFCIHTAGSDSDSAV